MGKQLFVLGALCGLAQVPLGLADVPDRDCFVGSPPLCNNSLASDTACRGLEVTTIDGWKRMDCDYVVYNVPTEARDTKKWIVIHSGGCDTNTGEIGDFFAVSLGLNLFGLRPCGGFADSLCASRHDYSQCNAFHISWYMPQLHPTYAPYGIGFNPPALVDIFHTPDTHMIFLHEYGSTNETYNWFPANGCNATSAPLYMCLAGIDPDYDSKFAAIKRTLETAFSLAPGFPCKLEVINTMPYSQPQDASVPCTGILREYNDPAKVGGDAKAASNWAWEMPGFMTQAIQLATEVDPNGPLVAAFGRAINIALCQTFDNAKALSCCDGDTLN
ncbi:hypothetical protein DCS_05767 [Drechmeria coniospora]|uniref:Uncharacterized protein n=1 Tax=Drechmeria coniospora TaxID=98403 RepID=A0A151GNR5_DRECN|nr:hypothetical protein DCS_05767 [Drechmeria coniospora]KYK58749.1 hypothetical protein DCS_05767 [Drechmeria coniospora]